MKTMQSFKSIVLLTALTLLGSVVFAQEKQPKSKPASSTTTPPAQNPKKKDAALIENSPAPSVEDVNIVEPEKMQERGAISEQGMPSDQPRMKPATSTTAPASNTPAKPKTESKSPATSPK